MAEVGLRSAHCDLTKFDKVERDQMKSNGVLCSDGIRDNLLRNCGVSLEEEKLCI